MASLRAGRRGFTLRELMLAITIGGAVMTTAVGLVHHAFDWSTMARHRRMDDQCFFSLSRQLRDDLHLTDKADLVSSDTSGQTLKLTIDGGDVVYRVSDSTVTRTQTRDDVVVRNELYRFKRPRIVTLVQSESDQQIRLDVKSVTPSADADVPLWRSLRVTVGLRLRHQNGDITS